jgi:hypothetical protein
MAHGNPIAHNAGKIVRNMQYGIVLNVRVMSDGDTVDVAACDASVPDTRVRANRHITNDRCRFGNEDALPKPRILAKEFIELLVHVHEMEVNVIMQIVKIFDSICPIGKA